MAEIRCPMCGYMNPEDSDNCAKCGARLKFGWGEEQQEAIPTAAAAPQDDADAWLKRLQAGGDFEIEESEPESEGYSDAAASESFAEEEGGANDWLGRLRFGAMELEDEEEESATVASEPADDLGDGGDWLSRLRYSAEEVDYEEEVPEAVPAESQEDTSDAGDWLSRLRPEDEELDYAPEFETEDVAEEDIGDASEMLSRLMPIGGDVPEEQPPAAASEAAGGPSEADVAALYEAFDGSSDWLRWVDEQKEVPEGGSEVAEDWGQQLEQTTESAPSDESAVDWLQKIERSAVPVEEVSEEIISEEPAAPVVDWSAFAEEAVPVDLSLEEEETETEEASSGESAEDWLRRMAEQSDVVAAPTVKKQKEKPAAPPAAKKEKKPSKAAPEDEKSDSVVSGLFKNLFGRFRKQPKDSEPAQVEPREEQEETEIAEETAEEKAVVSEVKFEEEPAMETDKDEEREVSFEPGITAETADIESDVLPTDTLETSDFGEEIQVDWGVDVLAEEGEEGALADLRGWDEEPPAAEPASMTDLPDWLPDVGLSEEKEPIAPRDETTEEETELPAMDWGMPLDVGDEFTAIEDEPPAAEEVEEAVPVTEEPVPPSDAEGTFEGLDFGSWDQPLDADLPDWIKDLEQGGEGAVDWLSELPEAETVAEAEEVGDAARAASPEADLAEWMQQLQGIQPQELETEQPVEEEAQAQPRVAEEESEVEIDLSVMPPVDGLSEWMRHAAPPVSWKALEAEWSAARPSVEEEVESVEELEEEREIVEMPVAEEPEEEEELAAWLEQLQVSEVEEEEAIVPEEMEIPAAVPTEEEPVSAISDEMPAIDGLSSWMEGQVEELEVEEEGAEVEELSLEETEEVPASLSTLMPVRGTKELEELIMPEEEIEFEEEFGDLSELRPVGTWEEEDAKETEEVADEELEWVSQLQPIGEITEEGAEPAEILDWEEEVAVEEERGEEVSEVMELEEGLDWEEEEYAAEEEGEVAAETSAEERDEMGARIIRLSADRDKLPEWLEGIVSEDFFDKVEASGIILPEDEEDIEALIAAEREALLREKEQKGIAPAEPATDIPDWLAEKAPSEMAKSEEREAEIEEIETEEELPEWLDEIVPEDFFDKVEAAGVILPEDEEDVETIVAEEREALQRAKGEDETASPEPVAEIPDWLLEMAPKEGEETAAPEMTDEDVEEDEDLSDWLGEADSLDDEAVPDWLHEMGAAEEEGVSPEEEAADIEGFDEWMDTEVAADDEDFAPLDGDMPDWLKQLSEGVEPEESDAKTEEDEDAGDKGDDEGGEPPASTSGGTTESSEDEDKDPGLAWLDELDLLARAKQPERRVLDVPQLEVPLNYNDLPEWLRRAEYGKGERIFETGEQFAVERDIPEWLEEYRPRETAPTFAPDISQEPTEEVPRAGLLAGIQGVLRIVKPPESNTASDVVVPSGFIPNMDMQQAARFLQGVILGRETRVVQEAAKPRWRFGTEWVYRFAAIAMLTLIIIPFLLGSNWSQDFIAPTAPTAKFAEVIDYLDPDALVLIAFDYDMGDVGEMTPQARAVLAHLMQRGAKILTIGLSPQAAGLAQNVLDDVVRKESRYVYGRDYVNLGYIPAEAGARAFAQEPNAMVKKDYLHENSLSDYVLTENFDQLTDVALIINLAARQESLRWWIEQVHTPMGVPLVAGVSAALLPYIRPYYPAQIGGVLSGISGAAEYAAYLDLEGFDNEFTALDAQALVHYALVLTIIAVNVRYWWTKRHGSAPVMA